MITGAQRRYAMVILAIVYMFNFVDRQILAILLPAIKETMNVIDIRMTRCEISGSKVMSRMSSSCS